MAAIHFDSQSVKKQAKLLEEAADQILHPGQEKQQRSL